MARIPLIHPETGDTVYASQAGAEVLIERDGYELGEGYEAPEVEAPEVEETEEPIEVEETDETETDEE